MKKIAVIFAGGVGSRMETEIPKQFLKVYGKEIIIHTIDKFQDNENIDEIYVVCIGTWIPYLEELVRKYNLSKIRRIVPGGVSGQDSIFIGLSEVKKENDNAIVLIHDGVRPLITDETINKCISSTEEYGSAITVTPAYETPLISLNGEIVEEMLKRNIVYTAQAPQCFYLEDIYNAHLAVREKNPTYEGIVDSCGLMFSEGVRCHLIEGNKGNMKVTTPEDFWHLLGNFNARDCLAFYDMDKSTKKLRKEITNNSR